MPPCLLLALLLLWHLRLMLMLMAVVWGIHSFYVFLLLQPCLHLQLQRPLLQRLLLQCPLLQHLLLLLLLLLLLHAFLLRAFLLRASTLLLMPHTFCCLRCTLMLD